MLHVKMGVLGKLGDWGWFCGGVSDSAESAIQRIQRIQRVFAYLTKSPLLQNPLMHFHLALNAIDVSGWYVTT